MVKVYQVQQVSWNNGDKSDFDLPRHIGYYLSDRSAIAAMEDDKSHYTREMNQEEYVTRTDYSITNFMVKD